MKQKTMLGALLAVFTLLAGAGMLQAQKAATFRPAPNKPKLSAAALKPALRAKAATGFEALASNPSVPETSSMLRNSVQEEIAGTTQYDLQSNGCEPTRVHVFDNGEVSAAWTFSNQPDGSGWPDRGTGFNWRTNWLNSNTPNKKLEAGNLRTGFTNYLVTDDGTEFILAHVSKTVGYGLHTARRPKGQTTWTEKDVPTSVPAGELWSRATSDGNTIHVLALSTPTGGATNGEIYRGMDGHVLYWRSKDAGATWDIVDGVIPGLDSSAYYELDADKYTIAARDGKVAVGIFDSWNDCKVFISEDGGDTWNTTYTLWDFPLDKYITDQGYTEDEIGGADPNAPNPLAIFTFDGSAAMLIDALGNVNVFVGETYVLDQDLTDDNTSYYPGINGLIYWNESLPDDLTEITYSHDYNGNDTLDFTGVVGYSVGLSSMPACASDDNGGLYLAYSAGVENLADGDGNNYRHVYAMKSADFGATWPEDPVDIVYYANSDSILANLSEAVWPTAYKQAPDKFHFVYQRDFVTGSAVQQANNQEALSDIVYVGIPSDDPALLGISGTGSAAVQLPVSLSPNPATDASLVGFQLTQRGETTVEILDRTGALVSNRAQGDLAAGSYAVSLNTAGLANGFYFVRVRSGNATGLKKLVVLR